METTKYWGYTSFWNLIDRPSVSFPSGIISNCKEELECLGKKGLADYKNGGWNETDKKVKKEWTENMKEFDGIDVGLQLLGRRFEEGVRLETLR